MLWLRNFNSCPPGEFYFRTSEAPGHTFGPSPLIGKVAADLSEFRKGNNLPRSAGRECLEDVVLFTVARLDPRSEWVVETDQTPATLIPQASAGCSSCGAVINS